MRDDDIHRAAKEDGLLGRAWYDAISQAVRDNDPFINRYTYLHRAANLQHEAIAAKFKDAEPGLSDMIFYNMLTYGIMEALHNKSFMQSPFQDIRSYVGKTDAEIKDRDTQMYTRMIAQEQIENFGGLFEFYNGLDTQGKGRRFIDQQVMAEFESWRKIANISGIDNTKLYEDAAAVISKSILNWSPERRDKVAGRASEMMQAYVIDENFGENGSAEIRDSAVITGTLSQNNSISELGFSHTREKVDDDVGEGQDVNMADEYTDPERAKQLQQEASDRNIGVDVERGLAGTRDKKILGDYFSRYPDQFAYFATDNIDLAKAILKANPEHSEGLLKSLEARKESEKRLAASQANDTITNAASDAKQTVASKPRTSKKASSEAIDTADNGERKLTRKERNAIERANFIAEQNAIQGKLALQADEDMAVEQGFAERVVGKNGDITLVYKEDAILEANTKENESLNLLIATAKKTQNELRQQRAAVNMTDEQAEKAAMRESVNNFWANKENAEMLYILKSDEVAGASGIAAASSIVNVGAAAISEFGYGDYSAELHRILSKIGATPGGNGKQYSDLLNRFQEEKNAYIRKLKAGGAIITSRGAMVNYVGKDGQVKQYYNKGAFSRTEKVITPDKGGMRDKNAVAFAASKIKDILAEEMKANVRSKMRRRTHFHNSYVLEDSADDANIEISEKGEIVFTPGNIWRTAQEVKIRGNVRAIVNNGAWSHAIIVMLRWAGTYKAVESKYMIFAKADLKPYRKAEMTRHTTYDVLALRNRTQELIASYVSGVTSEAAIDEFIRETTDSGFKNQDIILGIRRKEIDKMYPNIARLSAEKDGR